MIKGYREFQSRSVRIFISSTFQDMDAERNLLVEDVFPRLRARYGPKGISISEVDLRWGIPQSLSADRRTLRICIDEIENCQPFFMGILGEREGYRPGQDELEMLDEHELELLDLDGSRGVSITEMEIHAGINVSTPQTASFHVRGADAQDNERLETFERRIAQLGYPCSRYQSLADFADQVVDAVSAMIADRFGEDVLAGLDETYRAHLAHLVAERSGVVAGGQAKTLLEAALADKAVHVWGGRGVGKTAMLAYLAETLGEELDQEVFFHFAVEGDSGGAEQLWYRLLEFLGAGPTDDEVGVDEVGLWLRDHPLERPTYVVVDDASRFARHQDVRGRLLALSQMDGNVRIICAGDDEPVFWQGISLELTPLEAEQVGAIARGYFSRFGKTLDGTYLGLLEANEALRNPILLRCLLNEQRTSLSFKGFDEGFARLASLDDFDGLVEAIGQRVEGQMAELGLHAESTWLVMGALAAAKGGLYEEELLSCVDALPLEWSIVRAALLPVLREYDGLWRVSNGIAREGLQAAVARHLAQGMREVLERLDRFFSSLAVTARVADERLGIAAQSQDDHSLMSLLGTYEIVAPLAAERRETLVGYLTKVQGRSAELVEPLASGMRGVDVSDEALDDLLLTLNDAGCYQAVVGLAKALRPALVGRDEVLLTLAKREARACYKMGASRYDEAIGLYSEAIRRAQSLATRDYAPLVAELTFMRAIVLKSSGHPRGAFASYEQAIASYRELGIEDGNASWALGNLASLLYLYGQDERSGELFDEAVRMRVRAFGERSPEVAWTYCYLFRLAFSTGDLERAGALASDAMRFYEESFGAEGPQFAWAEVNRANYLAAVGRLDEARELLLDSIDKNDRFMGGKKGSGIATYSLTSVGNLAVVDWLAGKVDEARERLAEVERVTAEVHGGRHPYVCNARLNLALTGSRDGVAERLAPVIEGLAGELGYGAPDVLFAEAARDAAQGGVAREVPGAHGGVYLARNNGAQLVVVPSWMSA